MSDAEWHWRWNQLATEMAQQWLSYRRERDRPGQPQATRYAVLADETDAVIRTMRRLERERPPAIEDIETE